MNERQLLSYCQGVYDQATITAGPLGRDGASVKTTADGDAVIAFRGTLAERNLVSALDWFEDFHAELVEADGFPGRVHEGFLAVLNSLWPAVFDALEETNSTRKLPPLEHQPPSVPWWKRLFGQESEEPAVLLPLPWCKRLYITGHSLGGALAQMAGVRLAALGPIVTTFASPMCGDAEFATDYPEDVALTRYEGDYDLVPHLPPYLFGYHPAGQVVREGAIPPQLREAAINRLIASRDWQRIKNAHTLAGGYATWVGGGPVPPAKPEARAA